MNKSSSLSSFALLSLLWENENRDYLDMICQFVLKSMPIQIGSLINIDNIACKMKEDYGFTNIPRQVIEKALVRLSKSKRTRPCYVRKENRQYVVIERFDSSKFDSNYAEMNRKINEVLSSLIHFLHNQRMLKDVNEEIASKILFNFFESYGLTVVGDTEKLRSITISNGEHNYYVARFIIRILEKEPIILQSLIDITKGFLIFKAVYYYSTTNIKSDIASKLRGTEFYIDCSLVIDALGYDSESDELAFDEMCQLIKSNGGRVCVFEHTIEEASNLLEIYARKQYERNAFSFLGLEARKYPQEVLYTIAQPQTITENLAKKQITIFPVPSYTPSDEKKNKYLGFQDEQKIEEQLKSYHKQIMLSNSRVNFDTISLSAIGRLRKDSHPTRIENCSAIMVTQDWRLCQCMRDLYPAYFPPEIDFAIHDIDLVSLLWVGQENAQSHLPRSILISYAFAACEINQEIMDKAIELTKKMELDNTIPKEAALIIRSQTAIKSILADITYNNVSRLNEASIVDSINEYIRKESKEDTQKAKEDGYLKGYEQAEHEFTSLLNEKERQLLESENNNRLIRNNMLKDAEEKAAKLARRAEVFMIFILISIGVLTLILSIISWIRSGISALNWSAIVLSLLTLLQIIDYVFGVFGGFLKKLPKIVYQKTFMYSQRYYIRKKEKASGLVLQIGSTEK